MLTFDESAHRYFWNGQPVPSVTQILAPLFDFSRIDPEVLKAKAALGTAVHSCCELLDQDDLDETTIRPEWAPYVDAYRLFVSEHAPVWSGIELRVFHPKLIYAGTLDRVGVVNGKPAVIDLKTSAQLHPATGLQTAAYAAALNKEQGKTVKFDRYALQLKPDGNYRLEKYKEEGDFAIFQSLLAVRRWCERVGLSA